MRDYNEFFRFTPHAVAYVIYMAGAFDTRRGEGSDASDIQAFRWS
jgi:hypothetical protein